MVALTRLEAISRIQQGLGWRTDKATEILLELRLKQTELEEGQTLPWWLEVNGTLSGTANVDWIALPTGFLRFTETSEFFYNGEPDSEIAFVDYDDLLRLGIVSSTGETETGAATYVAIRGSKLFVRPIPTEDFTIPATWFANDTDLGTLTDGDSNLWLTYAPQVLIGAAGMAMARDLDYVEAEARFQTMFQAALGRLISNEELRKSGRREYSVGAAA